MRRDVRRAAWFLWMRPLRRGLAEALLRSADRLGGASSAPVSIAVAGVLDAGLQLRAHALVAQAPALVRAVALDLALDVRHGACSDSDEKTCRGPGQASRPIARGSVRPVPGATARMGRWPGSTASATSRIIAHIDHGKSTLADRILELTGAVDPRDMRAQYLDSMDLERERGITIKAQNVRLDWKDHVLNLIDTPGHVDFGYEVSRSLAACEGVLLLVDAVAGHRGADARQLLPGARARPHDRRRAEQDRPARRRARPGRRRDRARARHPGRRDPAASRPRPARACPSCSTRSSSTSRRRRAIADAPLQALHLRLVLRPVPRRRERGARVQRHARQRRRAPVRPGERDPRRRGDRRAPAGADAGRGARARRGRLPHRRHQGRRPGAGRRDRHHRGASRAEALAGYRDPKPMVFCGLYPVDGDEYADLREALEKLRLNDSSFTYEPETSGALGFGFRCGFLGLLHMEIVRERLEREYDLSLVATAPNVEYRVELVDGARRDRRQPVGDADAERDRERSRSRSSTSPCSRRPSTSGRSWSSASSGAAR